MKYIERKYQQLIQDVERAYDNTCDTLKYHINELQKIIAEKDEEIEKLKGGDKLQKEIDTYNAQNNMNLEGEIAGLRGENQELKSQVDSARRDAEAWETRFYALVKEYGINLNRPIKKESVTKAKKQVKKRSKNVVCYCKDCGTYFQAKSKIAKYCSNCRDKRAKASRAKWLAKQAKKK